MKNLPAFLFAALLFSGTAASAATAPDTAAERAKPCLACHAAEDRKARDEYYPRLAGKPAGYLFNQMTHFRDGRRRHRAMSLLMEHLSDDYLKELAQFFSTQKPKYAISTIAATTAPQTASIPALINEGDAARKIPPCADCHGKPLLGVAPSIPGLLGLPADYISGQLGAWKVDTRHAAKPDCMAAIAKQLTSAEIIAVAGWLASQPLAAGDHAAASLEKELPQRCGSADVNALANLPAGKNIAPAKP